jgi:nucleoid-associated protein YgaU
MNRYQTIPVIRNSQGIRQYKDSKYPQVPLSIDDIYVITTEGDRLDLLAQQYYGDSSLWWIISIANETLSQNSLFIPLGTQLRIPSNPSTVLINYASLNK